MTNWRAFWHRLWILGFSAFIAAFVTFDTQDAYRHHWRELVIDSLFLLVNTWVTWREWRDLENILAEEPEAL